MGCLICRPLPVVVTDAWPGLNRPSGHRWREHLMSPIRDSRTRAGIGRARCPARRACAAEAERERRARIITADGEYQASKRLAAAANVMARDPAALQLR